VGAIRVNDFPRQADESGRAGRDHASSRTDPDDLLPIRAANTQGQDGECCGTSALYGDERAARPAGKTTMARLRSGDGRLSVRVRPSTLMGIWQATA